MDATDLERRLAQHEPGDGDHDPTFRQAAVAALLRPAAGGPEVLLMRRAVTPTDRWSGHIALPGGGYEEIDDDPWATAIRETHEEVGVDLVSDARRLCRLERVDASARGQPVGLQVTPFTFLETRRTAPKLGPEASEAFWFPLSAAAAGDLDHRHRAEVRGQMLLLPAWRTQGRVVWGLTHRILSGLIDVLAI